MDTNYQTAYQIETYSFENKRPIVGHTVYTNKETAEAVAQGMMKDYTEWDCHWTVKVVEVKIATF